MTSSIIDRRPGCRELQRSDREYAVCWELGPMSRGPRAALIHPEMNPKAFAMFGAFTALRRGAAPMICEYNRHSE